MNMFIFRLIFRRPGGQLLSLQGSEVRLQRQGHVRTMRALAVLVHGRPAVIGCFSALLA